MKKLTALILGLVLLGWAALAWAEANPQPSPVNLVLTAAQLERVNAARGDVAVSLTKEQIELVKKTYANFAATTVTLNQALVRPGNVIAIVVNARGEANPQPSP